MRRFLTTGRRFLTTGPIAASLRSTGPIAACLMIAPVLAPSPAAAQDAESFLAPGDPAPDFKLTGATRYGILKNRVRLSDFRGETVVLSFFFRARTPG